MFHNVVRYLIMMINIVCIIAMIGGLFFWITGYNYRKVLKNSLHQYAEVNFDENKLDVKISKKKYISILVVEMGLNENFLQTAMMLSSEISFGFSPYDHELTKNISEAKEDGHEVYLNLPLEPINYPINSQGNYSLLNNYTIEQNIENLKMILNLPKTDVEGFYVLGPDNYMNNTGQFQKILDEIKKSNKKLINTYPIHDLAIGNMIKKSSQALQQNIIWLDEELDEQKIQDKLDNIEEYTQNSDFLLIVTRPYPIVLHKINEWYFKNITSNDVQITHLSFMQDKLKQQQQSTDK